MQNRFFNHARAVQGLSVTVNDTGFMFTRGYVKKYGFNMKTITEDLELSMQCVINGQKVDWVPEAKVYNEQPLSVQQSMAQRTRWVNGFIQCFLNYFRPLLSSFSKRPTGVKIDMLMFLISLPIMIMSMISKLLYALLGLFRIFDTMGTMLNLTIMGIVSAFAFWGIGFLSVALERKHPVKLKKAVLTYPIFNVMWVVLYVKYIFRHTSEWKPIIHARNISIKEMETIEK
jgi:cellulose synthase/poly-beta-1,6-N-acetylglucosamine synthase-like glycosyltransferase